MYVFLTSEKIISSRYVKNVRVNVELMQKMKYTKIILIIRTGLLNLVNAPVDKKVQRLYLWWSS